mmetsp:Transcript_79759/g.222005  ORF Transcript_79759/g.222005 Transcript_79759/m.222005 type:complete len:117 (+) Transcript_79759:32-382(+)
MGSSPSTMIIDRELINASRDGDIELLEKLLTVPYVNVNCSDIDGWTPLLLAIKYGHAKIVTLLIQAGADVNKLTKTGKSSIALAKDQNKQSMIDTLLKHGADPTGVDDIFMDISIL